MNSKGLWMLIKKDIKEDLRIGQMNITLSLLVGLSLSFAGLFQATNRFTDFNPNVIDLYIPYLPVIIMIFAGVSIMQRSIYYEKVHKTFIPLLSIGIKPRTMWFSKLVASMVITYLISLLGILLYLIVIILLSGIHLPSLNTLFISLFFAPIFPAVLIAVIGFIYLCFFNPWPLSLIFILVPSFLLPIWYKLLTSYVTRSLLLYIISGCIIVISLIWYLTKYIPRHIVSGALNRE
jgi:hypothetical protein